MVTVWVSAEVDLSDIDDDDLEKECESRGIRFPGTVQDGDRPLCISTLLRECEHELRKFGRIDLAYKLEIVLRSIGK